MKNFLYIFFYLNLFRFLFLLFLSFFYFQYFCLLISFSFPFSFLLLSKFFLFFFIGETLIELFEVEVLLKDTQKSIVSNENIIENKNEDKKENPINNNIPSFSENSDLTKQKEKMRNKMILIEIYWFRIIIYQIKILFLKKELFQKKILKLCLLKEILRIKI